MAVNEQRKKNNKQNVMLKIRTVEKRKPEILFWRKCTPLVAVMIFYVFGFFFFFLLHFKFQINTFSVFLLVLSFTHVTNEKKRTKKK